MTDTEIKQVEDGKWMTPPRKRFYRSCCDCGLVHGEQYRIRNGALQFRVWRDQEETEIEREKIGLEHKIQMAILAALGCTTVDYRSPLKLDAAATQITRFVMETINGTHTP